MSDLISKSEYGKAIGLKIEMIGAKIDNYRNHILAQSVMNDWASEIKGLYDALIILDYAPTVDAVEVVRCRECKFYLDAFGGHTCVNDFWNDECVIPTEPNDFCSYGERKEATE